jgi:microcystin-dependent protein
MEPFLGEIRAVAFNFAPKDWAVCDGSLLQIRNNTALFSILGTTYGGNGTTNFALPDLRGRAMVDAGQGPGLALYQLGEVTGTESVTLVVETIPPHLHGISSTLQIHNGAASTSSPSGALLADSADYQYGEAAGSGTMAAGMAAGTATAVGSSLPHSNLMPYTAVSYIIATQGIFPPHS